MTTTTRISVVVASFSGARALARCLASITSQSASDELLVPTDLSGPALEPLRQAFPSATFIAVPLDTSVFRRRTIGVERASGDIIVLTEDHCTAAPQWLAELRCAFDAGHDIVGGPVDNGLDRRIYDWSLYFCEYLWHTPRLEDGPASSLSGVNVAYRRHLLEECRDTWRQAFYENQVHDRLQHSGHCLHRASRALVSSHLEMTLAEAVRHLYGGGKNFGRYRQARASRFGRLLWMAAGPLVPVVLLWRMVTTLAIRRPGRLGTLVLGLPYVFCMIAAWSAGEAAGNLAFGPVRRAAPLL